MSKHTPGPWEIEEHYHFGYRWISGPQHSQLAQVVWCMEDEDRSPECEANARLIAAAPDLLAACEAAFEWVNSLDEFGVLSRYMVCDGGDSLHKILRRAIRQAKEGG